jgi:NAD(P)-dependent dehydrogenase (short-subunit alcohol dehydrogenase family)
MRIWVIGGTSGIGAAVAKHFAEDGQGNDVFITGKEIDVRDEWPLSGYLDNNGPFDIVIYSAGVNRLNWIHPDLDMLDIYDVNVAGFVRVLGLLIGTTCRSVVAISSDAATRPMRTSIAYCASKAALDMAVRCAARELAPGIRVNAVSPGMTANTEMTTYIDATVPKIRGWTKEHAAEYEKSQSPIGRRGTPQEIARVVYDVATGPDFMTGSIVPVNGGR